MKSLPLNDGFPFLPEFFSTQVNEGISIPYFETGN